MCRVSGRVIILFPITAKTVCSITCLEYSKKKGKMLKLFYKNDPSNFDF